MKYIQGITHLHMNGNIAITLGKFDGLHRGHQKLINYIMDIQEEDLFTAVFAFDIPPNTLIHGNKPEMLLTNAERNSMLEKQGIDYLIECPFTKALSKLSPEEFVKEILVEKIHVKYICVGEDFGFGYQRRGNHELLKKMGAEYGFQLKVFPKEQFHHREISSSYAKEELRKGNIETVNKLLGYPYTIIGRVEYGNQLGRTIGVPTVNQIPADDKLLPPDGVYVSKTTFDHKVYIGITNIGYKPTVESEHIKGVETFLFDYEGDLYGKEIQVGLYQFVRPERKFNSLDLLKEQLDKDIAYGRKYFQESYLRNET